MKNCNYIRICHIVLILAACLMMTSCRKVPGSETEMPTTPSEVDETVTTTVAITEMAVETTETPTEAILTEDESGNQWVSSNQNNVPNTEHTEIVTSNQNENGSSTLAPTTPTESEKMESQQTEETYPDVKVEFGSSDENATPWA